MDGVMSISRNDPDADPLTVLDRIHEAVDRDVEPLHRRHAARLECRRGCSGCCVDHLTVFAVEADKIRRDFPDLLREGRPYPAGGCAFLDAEGACRVYESRPYVCRTQGLPQRWTESGTDGRVLEYRDICPLNIDPDAPVEGLDAGDCWTLGPAEATLAELQSRIDGGTLRRVTLRSLFRRTEPLEIPEPAASRGEDDHER